MDTTETIEEGASETVSTNPFLVNEIKEKFFLHNGNNEIVEDNMLADPAGKRWDPLGAANDDDDQNDNSFTEFQKAPEETTVNRVKLLEDEQEMLTSSLLALTSHFAQVQFRLKQICNTPNDSGQRDDMLKSLEEFAFRGISEVNGFESNGKEIGDDGFEFEESFQTNAPKECCDDSNTTETSLDSKDIQKEQQKLFNSIEEQRNRQYSLIEQLKTQINNLDKCVASSNCDSQRCTDELASGRSTSLDPNQDEIVIKTKLELIEKQKLIIDELKQLLNLQQLDGNELTKLSSTDIKAVINSAVYELIGPIKMNEKLIDQLKTQISDLERFVSLLQCETFDLKQVINATDNLKSLDSYFDNYNTYSKKLSMKQQMKQQTESVVKPDISGDKHNREDESDHSTSSTTSSASSTSKELMTKAASILHMFATTQLGYKSIPTEKNRSHTKQPHPRKSQMSMPHIINPLKSTDTTNHWGAIRAQVEVDIQDIYTYLRGIKSEESEMEQSKKKAQSTKAHLTILIRKKLCESLQRLMEHGARWNAYSKNKVATSSASGSVFNQLVTSPILGCFNINVQPRSSYYDYDNSEPEKSWNSLSHYDEDAHPQQMSAWDVVMEYYQLKNGYEFNKTPAKTLSTSFNLNLLPHQQPDQHYQSHLNVKHSLLSSIDKILSMHKPYKQSSKKLIKALICDGLNQKLLTKWLLLIYNNKHLSNMYYMDWSYVSNQHFHDLIESLDELNNFYDFDLPIDIAVSQFQNINDMFI